MPEETASLFSKPVIDPINSVTWFAMDALWMAKYEWPAYIAGALTVVTGVWLLLLDRRAGRGAVFAAVALICWIVMNTVWMLYDLIESQSPPRSFTLVIASVGGLFMFLAARHSEDLRRLRILKRGDDKSS